MWSAALKLLPVRQGTVLMLAQVNAMPHKKYDIDAAGNLMPDVAELLYKASFNRAWGDGEGPDRQQLETAHKNAISAVERKFCKTKAGIWIKV